MVVMKRPPILVTGAPRSGTTFLGAMLSLSPGVVEIEEPFNFETGIIGMNQPFLYMPVQTELSEEDEHYAQLIETLLEGGAWYRQSPLRPETNNPFRQLARSLLVSRQNLGYKLQAKNPFTERYVIKDANACFMAEYMDQHFQTKTVVIMRHPAATIASYMRLGWRYDLDGLMNQPALMHDFLEPIIGKVKPKAISAIEEWAYLWLCIYVVLTQCADRDKRMTLITHDHLSQKPQVTLHKLYDELGLEYTPAIHEEIERHTSRNNPAEPREDAVHDLYRDSAAVNKRWKKLLSPEEVATIRRITEPIAYLYFDDKSWDA
jgi:hypothetical protein